MKKDNNVIEIKSSNKNTMSFFELLKLKIENQNDNLSKGFTYFSMFLSVFDMLILNSNYINIGVQSKILANATHNFWITLILILPYIFLGVISLISCLLSKFFKTEFVGKLSFIVSIINFSIVFFFLIFIAAVF